MDVEGVPSFWEVAGTRSHKSGERALTPHGQAERDRQHRDNSEAQLPFPQNYKLL